MRRREFIGGLGGAAVMSRVTNAQQRAPLPIVAHLSSRSPRQDDARLTGFQRGLNESGYADGKNVQLEYHWLENQPERLHDQVNDLVRRKVAVLYTSSSAAALIAKSLTTTIPVVFTGGSDPVKLGLVASLNRPGGNLTGSTIFSHEMATKRMELLRELKSAAFIALLVNTNNPSSQTEIESVKSAADTLHVTLLVVGANRASDLDAAFKLIQRQQAQALIVADDPFVTSQRNRIIAFAAATSLPAIYPFREHVEDGGLISYGASFADASRQAGIYVGKILTGTSPKDLPVLLPHRFELAINLRTARTLGLTVPATLLARADEVIE